MNAAEELMAERGAGAVSLRQIAKFAGERNHAVVQYHFGTREDLVDAILEHRTARIDGRRREMIDELEASGRSRDLRAIVEAAVYPLAELLGVSGPGGEVYLVFLLQLRSARTRGLFPRIGPGVAGMRSGQALAQRCLSTLPAAIVKERFNLLAGHVMYALAEHVRRADQPADEEGPYLAPPAFVSNLVDTAVAGLSAPVSEQTARELSLDTERTG